MRTLHGYTLEPTTLPGAWLITPRHFEDARGSLIKPFSAPSFEALGVPFTPRESFYSNNRKNVVRGMHFQRPPQAYDKLVSCCTGAILDVMVDLRRGETYGKVFTTELSAANGRQLFIPQGIAHGFLSLHDSTLVAYLTDVAQSPEHEAGVRWDSIDFEWPIKDPILSERDRSQGPLTQFASPF